MLNRNEYLGKISGLINDRNYHKIEETVDGMLDEIEEDLCNALLELEEINGISDLGNIKIAKGILDEMTDKIF